MDQGKLTIKAIRVNLNETQKEFADHIGLNLKTYQLKEQGKTQFTWNEINTICEYAKVPISLVKPM